MEKKNINNPRKRFLNKKTRKTPKKEKNKRR